nr:hypothetical protein [uncultured Acetatifactor sp.]
MSSKDENNGNINAESENYGVDDVTELSAEEIEKLLAESAGIPEEEPEDAFAGDVLEMLEEAGDDNDDNLKDIQEMLQRADRNETIQADEPEETGFEENPVDRLLADIERASEEQEAPLDAKTRKAREKARKSQEKAQKAAEKKAQKEAMKAEKAARKGGKKRIPGKKRGGTEAADAARKEPEEIMEYDLTQDKELLDSIVSQAGDLGKERKSASQEQRFSVNELGAEFDAAKEREDALKSERIMERDVEEKETAESGIMELDMDEIDAFIPDISNGPKEQTGKKKGSLMSKIIKMLTEEEEPENEDLKISDENQEIIKDLDKEKQAGGKKAKKAKKPAKKKEQKKKAPKPAKPKKPKKVKEKEPYVPGKKITFRKALPILLLGATIGAVLFIFVNLVTDFTVKKEAEEAFRDGNYAICYQNLHGKKLNDEQTQMYGKSESILYMEQEYRRYDIVVKNGSQAEALDSLLQTVNNYPAVFAYASQCQAVSEVEEIYARIIGILLDKYGLTEDEAKKIASMGSSIEYTRAVNAVADGNGYQEPASDAADMEEEHSMEEQPETGGESAGVPEDDTEALPDRLPEEPDLGENDFVDN